MPLAEFKLLSELQLHRMPHKNLAEYAQTLKDRIEELEAVVGLLPKNEIQFKFCHFTPTEERYLGMIYKQEYVCTKEVIFRAVYGGLPEADQPLEIKIVDVVVHHIRKKLKRFGIEIHTMWGRGYYFDDVNRKKMQDLIESVPRGCLASKESPMMLRANAV